MDLFPKRTRPAVRGLSGGNEQGPAVEGFTMIDNGRSPAVVAAKNGAHHNGEGVFTSIDHNGWPPLVVVLRGHWKRKPARGKSKNKSKVTTSLLMAVSEGHVRLYCSSRQVIGVANDPDATQLEL